MSNSPVRGLARRRAVALFAAGVVASGALASYPAANAVESAPQVDGKAAASLKSGRYVVILKEDSATTYDGGTAGLAATRSPKGKFNPRTKNVRAYEAHLRNAQRRLADSVGATIDQQYTLATNGFTADLTGKQATELAASRDVLMVTEDTAYELDTWNTPNFLGMEGADGVWAKAGGPAEAGDGVVVGILDTGIWPENPSFAGDPLTSTPQGKWGIKRDGDTITMNKADGGTWRGFCEPGDGWEAADCNTKLVGARYYPEAFLAGVPEEHRGAHEYISTRDGGGHGSHTAGTAAGNHGVEATVDGREFGSISGMAPAAKIAAYKVCFEDDDPNTGGCYGSATIAAIDDAIEDGVDVINYSISGATTTVVDAVEYAFFGAAAAGVFVAASAGNSGPGASTVAHNSPWITTVAASTHTVFENTLVLGDGTKLNGASIASAEQLPGSASLVEAVDVAADGADPAEAAMCFPDTLDPAKVAGTIVVCDRGVIARVDKSAEVKRAGGVGTVLVNITPGSLDADFHTVPTIHLDSTDEPIVRDYLATADPTASMVAGDQTGDAPTPVPQIAGFSSRGPALANESDVIKPDISAPGVSVLAPVAPPSNSGRDWDLYSGTSMSSPHVAGLAAFVLGERPSWTPMMVKSAMMTTAHDLKDGAGKAAQDPFAQGAGHVSPARFLAPGLVVTSGPMDWVRFYEGQGLDFGDYAPMAASDLNVPSIAQGQVVGSTTLSRKFTALKAGTYNVKVQVPGFSAQHRKRMPFTKAGQSQKLEIEFTRTDAPLAKFATGFVTLSGPTTVRIPVALRPVSVKAPAEVAGSGADGSVDVAVTAGFTGDLAVEVAGLEEARTQSGSFAAGDYTAEVVTIGEGTRAARWDLDAANNAADLDLYVYRMNDAQTALVYRAGLSATGSADESVTLRNPEAGHYYVVAEGYATAPGESTSDYRLDEYLVDESSTAGGFTATPNPVPVTTQVPTTFTASWSGVDPSKKYLGVLEYDGALSPTFVSVN